jgi:hypothetical protein
MFVRIFEAIRQAMILPNDLHPLPVSSDELDSHVDRAPQGFVNESVVRHLLVGPLTVGHATNCYRGRDGEFAGSVEESPFVSLAIAELHEEEPAKAFGAPAGEPRTAGRAAPPRPRRREPLDAAPSTRPWVISAAMLMVGFFVGNVIFALQNPIAKDPPAPVVPTALQAPSPEEAGPALVSAHSSLP